MLINEHNPISLLKCHSLYTLRQRNTTCQNQTLFFLIISFQASVPLRGVELLLIQMIFKIHAKFIGSCVYLTIYALFSYTVKHHSSTKTNQHFDLQVKFRFRDSDFEEKITLKISEKYLNCSPLSLGLLWAVECINAKCSKIHTAMRCQLQLLSCSALKYCWSCLTSKRLT